LQQFGENPISSNEMAANGCEIQDDGGGHL
jgi:hypothetical protein